MPVTISGNGIITGVEFPVPSIKEKRVAHFTGNGTWTVPAGVTYAIAHVLGGGGGSGGSSSGGDGAASSVAFASGTLTAAGGGKASGNPARSDGGIAGPANSGVGAVHTDAVSTGRHSAMPGAHIVAAANVTPAATIAVVVGAGGSAGTSGAAGGSGYVYIEYEIDPEDEI